MPPVSDAKAVHGSGDLFEKLVLIYFEVFSLNLLPAGHGKPVDIWAMGVITYFLLAGYIPFDRETPQQGIQAIITGDYRFEPEEYWQNVSTTAKDFVTF